MTTQTPAAKPQALLLLSSSCPHCPTVLQGLAELVKAGHIGRLEVVNIEAEPDTARKLGVRSVPWVRIGAFELEGLHTRAELANWAERAGNPAGRALYLAELLTTGQMQRAQRLVRTDPSWFEALLDLLEDTDTELSVRIGIGALVEEFARDPALLGSIQRLGAQTRHSDARIRSDAAYYLGLTGSDEAKPFLEALSADKDADVREISREALEELAQT